MLVSEKFPFLQYAVHNMLITPMLRKATGFHKKPSSKVSLFIRDLDSELGSLLTTSLSGMKIRRHTLEASLLYILAEKNLSNLIPIQLVRFRILM